MNTELTRFTKLLIGDTLLLDRFVVLSLPGMMLKLRSNSHSLLSEIEDYFRYIANTSIRDNEPFIEIIAVESQNIDLDVNWVDWSREAGKTGKKDAYHDVDGGRLIRKMKTGLVFLQSHENRIVVGQCLANLNQVVNFINNQYMNDLQQQDWLICHAAALSWQSQGIAFAGFSGGGKSTSMLHVMNSPEFDYVTNDRLFIKESEGKVMARGVPKLPRINPGTIINNQTLRGILNDAQIETFESMPASELWDLEDKYDVDVAKIYGEQRLVAETELRHLIILNWSRNCSDPIHIDSVNIEEKKELLAAVMKSSGPFYQYANGNFYQDYTALSNYTYIDILNKINVIEVTGGVDFSALESYCLALKTA